MPHWRSARDATRAGHAGRWGRPAHQPASAFFESQRPPSAVRHSALLPLHSHITPEGPGVAGCTGAVPGMPPEPATLRAGGDPPTNLPARFLNRSARPAAVRHSALLPFHSHTTPEGPGVAGCTGAVPGMPPEPATLGTGQRPGKLTCGPCGRLCPSQPRHAFQRTSQACDKKSQTSKEVGAAAEQVSFANGRLGSSWWPRLTLGLAAETSNSAAISLDSFTRRKPALPSSTCPPFDNPGLRTWKQSSTANAEEPLQASIC